MAGAGYKLFNTGDVLTAAQVNTYLMEQTVMVFADAAARTTALTGVVSEGMISYLKDTNAVEVYNGSAWVASDDPNAIQNTIVDAKGDLIAATAADTPARLAVGSNGDTLVADSAATTGLRWQGSAIGKNLAINGACEIAQRGTAAVTLTAASFLYPVDRFFVARSAGTTGATAQQITSTGLDGFQNAVRIQRTAGNTATNDLIIGQSFESANSIPLANKSVVISFWARAGSNYSATSNALAVRFYTGTGTDQAGYGSSFTGTATPISQTATLTTSWQRFQYTATLASTTTQVQFLAFATPTGTAGANDFFDITGLQVELGSVATPFSRSGGTIQGELAACQRYYERTNWDAATGYATFGQGAAQTTTNARTLVPFQVQKRVRPTAIDYPTVSTNFRVLDFADNVIGAPSAVAFDSNQTSTSVGYLNWTTSGATVNRPYLVTGNNTASAYLGWSSEL